jgi:hypothetical protein
MQRKADQFDERNAADGTFVAEIRPLTRDMQLHFDPDCTPDDIAVKLGRCTKYQLEWSSYHAVSPILPQTELYGQPTCAVDTHVFEHVIVNEITGLKILDLPGCLDFDRYLLNVTFSSDTIGTSYAGWMQVGVIGVVYCVLCAVGCVLYAVCCVRCAVCWALCALCSVLCVVCCVLCAVCCILCAVCCVPCAVCRVLCAVWCVLCAVRCVLCAVRCVFHLLCACVLCVLCAVCCVQCAVGCGMCAVCRVLCGVCCEL